MSGSDPFGDDNDFSFDDIFSSDDDLHSSSPTSPSDSSNPVAHLSGMKRRTRSGVPIPIVSSVLSWLYKTISTTRTPVENHPHLRAMYNQLHIATETQTDYLATHFKLESQLVSYHRQLRFANTATLALEEVATGTNEELDRLILYIRCWIDFTQYSLEITKQQYTEFAGQYGLKMFPSVRDSGKYPYITPEMEVFGGSPPGLFHYQYGEVDQLPDQDQDIFELMFRIMVEIVLKESKLDPVFSSESLSSSH